MSALGARRKRTDPDIEINMVPIMNMFLVLIPFLLMSSSFLHLRAIDTSVPVRAVPQSDTEETPKSDIIVTAVIQLSNNDYRVSITSGELSETQLQRYDSQITRNAKQPQGDLLQLAGALKTIKDNYPKSNTLILTPSDDVLYEDIVEVMDAARKTGDIPLFPVVVLSGEVAAG
ncbi:biopolymer transport protein ExbD [Alteromonadaceae bacterium 2753L.S.0a.02]|nr:biopolymer transport protein ExbD [Alteromonadaceae bacterium 2753L.S.0a.02]